MVIESIAAASATLSAINGLISQANETGQGVHKVMGMIALVVVGGDVSNKDSIAKVKMMGRGKKKLAELLGQI